MKKHFLVIFTLVLILSGCGGCNVDQQSVIDYICTSTKKLDPRPEEMYLGSQKGRLYIFADETVTINYCEFNENRKDTNNYLSVDMQGSGGFTDFGCNGMDKLDEMPGEYSQKDLTVVNNAYNKQLHNAYDILKWK